MYSHNFDIEGLSSWTDNIDNITMQILGPATFGENRPAFALGVDTACIITKVASVKEARALPTGSVVGDLHGGLTFTDAVAAALEARSTSGWQEMQIPSGEIWTTIIINR
jgi:uncharacterized transporter YbjL